MFNYLIRRLILLPITLFFILLINFVIVNLAPGEPVNVTEISSEGNAVRREDRSVAFGSDERYLQFREFYGLTLPILFNDWPMISSEQVRKSLWQITYRKQAQDSPQEFTNEEYKNLKVNFGDKARFVMPFLLQNLENAGEDLAIRSTASQFFARGGTRQAFVGPYLSALQKLENRKISEGNFLLRTLVILPSDSESEIGRKIARLKQWYGENKQIQDFEPDFLSKVEIFFFETRFFRYMHRVVTLDFGTVRNDDNKTVVSEVTKRFKYSLTLALLPMLITFFLCQFFGALMALFRNQWPDFCLNVIFLVLYAIPVFVAVPFLIENVALHGYFPWTHIPIPLSGFTNPEHIYAQETSSGRLFDILQHIALPLVAIIYGSLAAQTRLSRTAILEVLHQDYVRTALAKGVSPFSILYHHVGRNAAITIVTSIAGSLGVILGGSLIVETLFGINGFGKFFYDAVLNRDYNVIMFSALAGSFLTLLGYLVADIAYTLLDPRVTLD